MAQEIAIPRKLWEHPNPKSTRIWRFMQDANKKRGLNMQTFRDLYSWSVGDHRLDFWEDMWKEAELIYDGSYKEIVDTSAPMDSIPQWFRGVRLNYAENILYSSSTSDHTKRSTRNKEDSKIAVTEIREGNTEVRDMSWGELRRRVGLLSNAFRARGIKKGDRVAIVGSTSFDTLICFLAVTSLGGLFSSSSTDMGTKGILERLLQIKPMYLFFDDWAVYNGKTIDLRPKMKEIVEGMRTVPEFKGIVTQPRFLGKPADLDQVSGAVTLDGFLKAANGNEELKFEKVEFRDPFLIVYSSGTTGVPKCIVHSVGGVLLNSNKEYKLQSGMGPDDVALQYTTTGWIMYLVSVQYLLLGARTILYDGSPFIPHPRFFLNIIDQQGVTYLGISPRFLHELQKQNISPRESFLLSSLQSVSTTGMVLSDALFEWFYDTAFSPSVHLRNVSGGTDLAGALAGSNPLEPVYVGGCQGTILGTKVEVYDSTIESGPGRAVPDGEPGELVATASFPNQPVFFWGDRSGERYHNAYYAHFPHVWTHGDFIQIHPVTKQVLFLGRADGVLNPSGVRFGSSEIYSVIETHFPEIQDSICVGQRRPQDNDESVLLFLMMNQGHQFTAHLVERVKRKIREERSARHVPKYVFQTHDIPTTVNLKKVELPVKQIVSGRIIKPSGTLANPQSLDYYYQFAKIEEVIEKMEKEKAQKVKSRL